MLIDFPSTGVLLGVFVLLMYILQRTNYKTSRYIGEGTIIDSKVPIRMGYMFGVGAGKNLQPLEKQGGGRVKGALEFEE